MKKEKKIPTKSFDRITSSASSEQAPNKSDKKTTEKAQASGVDSGLITRAEQSEIRTSEFQHAPAFLHFSLSGFLTLFEDNLDRYS